MTDLIQQSADNRLGAVHSALAFGLPAMMPWRRTDKPLERGATRGNYVTNDSTSTPDQLLGTVLPHQASGDTNFTVALQTGRNVMEQNWSTVSFVIFYLAILQLICFDISATQSASHDLPV